MRRWQRPERQARREGGNPKWRKNLAKPKRERKPYALTLMLVIPKAAGPWQSRRSFRLPCRSRKLKRRLDCHVATLLAMTRGEPPGLPRRYAPRL